MTAFNGFRLNFIHQLIVIFALALVPLTDSYAKAGCCSSHGGVAGCDSSTGRQSCKDGTVSPSCACNGTTVTPAKKSAKAAATTAPAAAAPAAATTTATTKPASTKGCCARHGGVGQCNTSAGYLMCKDGTQSTSCKCS